MNCAVQGVGDRLFAGSLRAAGLSLAAFALPAVAQPFENDGITGNVLIAALPSPPTGADYTPENFQVFQFPGEGMVSSPFGNVSAKGGQDGVEVNLSTSVAGSDLFVSTITSGYTSTGGPLLISWDLADATRIDVSVVNTSDNNSEILDADDVSSLDGESGSLPFTVPAGDVLSIQIVIEIEDSAGGESARFEVGEGTFARSDLDRDGDSDLDDILLFFALFAADNA